MTKSEELAQLARSYWDLQKREFPIAAIQAGEAPESPMLMREAPADHERRAGWAREALLKLAEIDRTNLSSDDRATHALLERELELLVQTLDCDAHLRPPLHPLGPDFLLQSWASATALETMADGRTYIDRLRAIPAALGGVREALAEGVSRGYRYPRLVIERAAERVRGALAGVPEDSAFAAPLNRLGSRSPAMAEVAAEGRSAVAELVYPAFSDFADFIQTELGAVARESISCVDDKSGEALYRYLIRQSTTLALASEEIHALGLKEVERIEAEMAAVADCDLDSFRERLRTDEQQFAESGEALRGQIEILSKRIDGRIPEFFGHLPRMTYGIRSIPEAIAEKMPPAYAQPNPADAGAAGIHWVTSIPGKCPRYMHIPLALHEAWPGHLMHLALIQEMEHLPSFRRYGALRYSACLEGWALYSERLGEEMGLYDSPESRYGRLEMEMWRAVRLVVDTGIHALGWSRERAIRYFETYMAMPCSTIEGEIDRYIGWPGQALAYQLGNLKFHEIRRRTETALGDDFRIRDFHDALMRTGPVTLPVLDQLMQGWTADQLSGKN